MALLLILPFDRAQSCSLCNAIAERNSVVSPEERNHPVLGIVADIGATPEGDAGTGAPLLHDGCFIAQDRGVRVKGEHVDLFTGHREITALWNRLVPSNRGVTVIVDHPRCARAAPAR